MEYDRIFILVDLNAIILDNLMNQFDLDIGRNHSDRPFNSSEIELLNRNHIRKYDSTTILRRQLLSNDELD